MAKSIWDEFKDLFKTKEQRDEEKRQGIDDALEREKDIVGQLEELDKQYQDSIKEEEPDLEKLFPSDSGLREHKYEAATDEEIESAAKALNDEEKAAKQKKLQNDYDADVSDVENDKAEKKRKLDEQYSALDSKYAAKGEDAKDGAIKQGVSRGSILSSVLGELSAQKQSEGDAAKMSYQNSVAALDDKLSSLERELNGALEQLDMQSAVDLTKQINELKKERNKEVQKWDKYNDDIRSRQAKFAYEREQDINEYLSEQENKKQQRELEQQRQEEKYGYQGEKQKNFAKRYDIAYDFYMSLDPSIALAAFEASPNMRYYLGLYYDQLKKELRSRNGSNTQYIF